MARQLTSGCRPWLVLLPLLLLVCVGTGPALGSSCQANSLSFKTSATYVLNTRTECVDRPLSANFKRELQALDSSASCEVSLEEVKNHHLNVSGILYNVTAACTAKADLAAARQALRRKYEYSRGIMTPFFESPTPVSKFCFGLHDDATNQPLRLGPFEALNLLSLSQSEHALAACNDQNEYTGYVAISNKIADDIWSIELTNDTTRLTAFSVAYNKAYTADLIVPNVGHIAPGPRPNTVRIVQAPTDLQFVCTMCAPTSSPPVKVNSSTSKTMAIVLGLVVFILVSYIVVVAIRKRGRAIGVESTPQSNLEEVLRIYRPSERSPRSAVLVMAVMFQLIGDVIVMNPSTFAGISVNHTPAGSVFDISELLAALKKDSRHRTVVRLGALIKTFSSQLAENLASTLLLAKTTEFTYTPEPGRARAHNYEPHYEDDVPLLLLNDQDSLDAIVHQGQEC